MLSRHLSRALALAAITGGLALAFGQGEAAAQADAAGEVRALRAELDQLTARVAALDAMLARQGRTITLSGDRSGRELVLRSTADLPAGITIAKADAVLRFDRIALIGKDITIHAQRTIDLKAAAITLDGQLNAKGASDNSLKGNKIGGN